MNRREFIATSAAEAAMLSQSMRAFAAPTAGIEASIDVGKVFGPVSPLIFGGYMEPATTRVWSELLYDRKFMRAVTDAPAPPAGNSFIHQGGQPWRPIGSMSAVEMDKVRPWVGEQSPRITLSGSEPRGIQQSGMRLGKGKSYIGRAVLAGDPTAKVQVRLVWGSGTSDSQMVTVPALSREYRKHPLKFTVATDAQDARIEIVGTGSGSFHVGTVSLMPADNVQGFHAGLIRHIKEAGFLMAKWPGGNFVSAYDWYDGLGDPDKRPPKPEPMWGNAIESNDVGLHEFFAFCKLIGAEPDLAVNTGFGEARVAAEEVEYCNGSVDTRLGKLRAQNGHPEPFNVRLWTIGNEMYGPWQYGYMPADQYCVKHNYFVQEMRKVDPKIKVTSAGASVCEASWCAAEQRQFSASMWQPPVQGPLPVGIKSTRDFDGWMLSNSADYIDFLSEHTYCYPDLAFDSAKQAFVDVHDPLELRARRDANRIGAAFEMLDRYKAAIPGIANKDIRFIFDEWGTRFRSAAGAVNFQRPVGMVTPMTYALFLHELFRHSDMVGASCPTGGLGTFLSDITGDAVGFAAEALMMKIMSNHFANAHPVAVDGNSPQQVASGTPYVDMGSKPTGSPTFPLDVVAAFSLDRKKFILSVVNPSEQPHQLTPHISGLRLGGGKLSRIVAPSITAVNVAGQEPVIKIIETPQGPLSEKLELPPISVSVYELDIEGV